jgi:hypothetical protein
MFFRRLDASVGASGPHDFAVRVSAARLAAPSASTASRPAAVTIASRPSGGQDGGGYGFDLGRARSGIFLNPGLDRANHIELAQQIARFAHWVASPLSLSSGTRSRDPSTPRHDGKRRPLDDQGAHPSIGACWRGLLDARYAAIATDIRHRGATTPSANKGRRNLTLRASGSRQLRARPQPRLRAPEFWQQPRRFRVCSRSWPRRGRSQPPVCLHL